MELRKIRKLTLWLCTMLLIVMFAGSAFAEKSWIEMGTGDVEVRLDGLGLKSADVNYNGLLTDYKAGKWYVFNVDTQNLSYATLIETQKTDCWYTLTVNNNGIGGSGWNLVAGLYLYVANGDGEWLIDNQYVNKGENSFRLRIEPGNPISLAFIALNNTTGVVSFEIVAEEDNAGEKMEEAEELTAGGIIPRTIGVPGDQDWYHIPAEAGCGKLSVHLENRIKADLSLEIYDEFKEQLVQKTCVYDHTAAAAYNLEPDVDYYIKVSSPKSKLTGRYFLGLCDGKNHSLEDRKIVTKPTCTKDGVSGQKCTICGEVFSSQSIPKLGHQAGSERTEVKPSCVAEGIARVHCTVCNEVLSEKPLPMVPHQYDSWREIQEPGLFKEGEEVHVCVSCGDPQFRPVPALTVWQWMFGR